MKEALPRMRARGRGHIVNIASTAGKVGFAGGATYSGTKHFVVGVSEACARSCAGRAIPVTCVMPGVVNTELSAGTAPARFVRTSTRRWWPTRSSPRCGRRASRSSCRAGSRP